MVRVGVNPSEASLNASGEFLPQVMSEADEQKLNNLFRDYRDQKIDERTLAAEVEKILRPADGENGTQKLKKWLPQDDSANATDLSWKLQTSELIPGGGPAAKNSTPTSSDSPYALDQLVWRADEQGPHGNPAVSPLLWRLQGSAPEDKPAIEPLIWRGPNEPSSASAPTPNDGVTTAHFPPLNWSTQKVWAQTTPPAKKETQTAGGERAGPLSGPRGVAHARNAKPEKKENERQNAVKANAQEDRSSNVKAHEGKSDFRSRPERKRKGA
jgi:hypothetical protein